MAVPTPDPYFARIGENIVAARKALNMTQVQLSSRARIHRTRLGKIERGEQNFTLDTLRALALGLGIQPDVLLAGVDLALLSKSLARQ